MKKLLFSAIVFGFSMTLLAQEAADKKVQAGIVVGTGLNFQKMGTKQFKTNGVGSDLTIGANVNFTLTDNIGLTTGVEFDFSTTKYSASSSDGAIFYRYNDAEVLRKQDANTSNSLFLLTERKQTGTYISIPTMALFRTNYIGYFRYFGKFGVRNSFLLSSKISDKGYTMAGNSEIGAQTAATNKGMKRKSEMLFYKGSVGLAGGAEWNISGSTCLAAEIGYYYGFTPLFYSHKEDKTHLYTHDPITGNNKSLSNAATQSQLALKISILF